MSDHTAISVGQSFGWAAGWVGGCLVAQAPHLVWRLVWPRLVSWSLS